MSDVEKLLAAFESGALLRPSSEVPNLVDLSRAIALLAGSDQIQPTPLSAWFSDSIGSTDHLVFVLADGLGLTLIEGLPRGSFLSTHLAAELRTVFPSATAVALTSIGTGQWPARHGISGWWTHLPEIEAAATILPFVKRADGRSLTDRGVTPEQVFPAPPVMGDMTRDALALFPSHIAGSIYSAYFAGGKARQSYRGLHEAVDIIVERVRTADRPTYTYMYTPRVDETVHRCGVGHPQVRSALADLDRQMERLEAGLVGPSRLVLSADHGFLDVADGAKHQIRGSDPLMGLLRFTPSGDARVLYLHVCDGAHERVRARFRERFGERFLLIMVDEAEALELFGPGPILPQTRRRMGDLIAISAGTDVIEYRPGSGPARITGDVSHHSGLTPSEMMVPLVIA
ncbi:MAG: alkaline phosphatase family protein [Dehalococcoidia bacterium]|nr:alkaline phosphatase family protein [Dehalococcoidia bacterium]